VYSLDAVASLLKLCSLAFIFGYPLHRPSDLRVTMRNTARQTRENRTITVDFQNEATYFQLLGDGKAFVECVIVFLLALGLQLKHKATCRGGGVSNSGTLTVLNSTIAGNTADYGGGVANSGTLTVTNSTISDNSARYGGGGVANSGTLRLVRTLVAGNTAPNGPEIVNPVTFGGTVLADSHNLFGVDGTAGVVGFGPGAMDVVPPAGVLLPDILDATGALLSTDQRGRPRRV
jgi:hypothetical protein